jgi:hypothetical protein
MWVVVIILLVIIGTAVIYWVVSPILGRTKKERDSSHGARPIVKRSSTVEPPPISRPMPPPHPTKQCPRCGSNRVEGVYGDEHQRYQCWNCDQIFQ